MNRFKPLSAFRDPFTISKASLFSGKLLWKHLFSSDRAYSSDSYFEDPYLTPLRS